MIALIIKFITDNKLACIFIVLWIASMIKSGLTAYERDDYKQQVSAIQLVLDQTKLDLTVQQLNNKQLNTYIMFSKDLKYKNFAQAKRDVKVSYLGNVAHSTKLSHSLEKINMSTYGIYLAPADLSGYNVCPNSSMCQNKFTVAFFVCHVYYMPKPIVVTPFSWFW